MKKLSLWFLLCITFCVLPVLGATIDLPKMLISAQTHDGRVRTDVTFFVSPSASAPSVLQTQSCTPFSPTIQPGGAYVLRDFVLSGWTCSTLPEFTLVPAPTNLESKVEIAFNQPPNSFSFGVGPIGAIGTDHTATATPVVNDAVDQTIINVFPATSTLVYWTLNNGKEESCTATPPVAQCHVAATGAGTLRVYLKVPTCGVGPVELCPAAPVPVYGLVTVGRRDGVSTLTSFPF